MKKYLLYLLLGLGSLTAWGQAFTPCDEKGIKTDPANPVNTELGSGVRLNTFDWTAKKYRINSAYIASDSLDSPWHQDDNLNVVQFLTDKDRLPKDGWELIKYDVGMNPNGTIATPGATFVYVVLYNRYTGVLRICVAGDRPDLYNGAQIKLNFKDGLVPEYYPSTLSHISEITSVEAFGSEDKEAVSISRYLNGLGEWFYADFAMAYDPCSCNFESKMSATVTLIDSAVVNLSGVIADSVLANLINKTQGSVSENGYSVSPKDLLSLGKTAQKAYKTANDFTKKQKDALKYEGLTQVQIEAKKTLELDLFQELLKSSELLQRGLAAYPYVAGALELVNFFVDGGKESGGSSSPVAINAGIKLKGSIFAPYDVKDIIFSTPGSLNANTGSQEQYPFYNEPMGVFNLLETPEVYSFSTVTTQCTSWTNIARPCPHMQGHIDWRDVWFRIKDDQSIKYVVNPSSGLEVEEIYTSLEFHYPKNAIINSYGIQPRNSLSIHATEGLDLENEIFRTHLVPLGCMEQGVLSLRGWGETSIMSNSGQVFLKVFVNLKRSDGLGQNVLWVGSYPVKLEPGDNAPPYQGPSFPTVYQHLELGPGGSFQHISSHKRSVDSIFVRAGTTFQSGVQLIAPFIVVDPGVTIPDGVELIPEYPLTCNNPLPPASAPDIATFCNSSKYKSSNRDASRLQVVEQQSPTIPLTAHPNPFTDELQIRYELAEEAEVSIVLINMMGRPVREVQPMSHRKPGPHELQLDLSEVASGMYTIVMQAGSARQTLKVIKR